MIFLIFTAEGLAEAASEIQAEQATVWLNSDLKNTNDYAKLVESGCDCFFLSEQADPTNERSVIHALSQVEKHSHDTEIYVEYL